MTAQPTIFVQIASYRDTECQWTIKDLFDKAEHPDRVFVTVCWQFDRDQDRECFRISPPNPTNTINIFFPAERSRGVCWARWQVQKMFDNEDYVLMIDSHMRFVENWDSEMIAELARCDSDKPFFSCYPASYTPPNNLSPDPWVSVLKAQAFRDNGTLRMEGTAVGKKLDEPRPNAFLAAGYLFTKGRFVREVPYDPHMYFDDEEITLAARAYTHGWDGFAPSRVLIYHYYNIPEKTTDKIHHWSDHNGWDRLCRISWARREYLLCGTQPADCPEALAEIESYGLGNTRTLAEYESFSGIDFKKREVSEMGLKCAVQQPKSVRGAERPRQQPQRTSNKAPNRPTISDHPATMNSFIVSGHVKSGTTFLQMLLDSHPNSSCPSEQHFQTMKRLINNVTSEYNNTLDWLDGVTGLQGIRFKPGTFNDNMLRSFILEMMCQGATNETTHAGLNDNIWLGNVDFYSKLLPTSKFVFIVRDPRDVGVSLWHHNFRVSEEFRAKNPPISQTILGTCKHWPKHVEEMRAMVLTEPRRARFVRYEDLTGPDRNMHLIEVLEFLGLEYDDEIIAGMWAATEFQKLQEKEARSGHEQAGFFRSGRRGGWRDALSDAQKHEVKDDAGAAMKLFSYFDDDSVDTGTEYALV